MARLLNLKVSYTVISSYEIGTGEPDLLTLLRYAMLGGVSVKSIIDDKMNLSK
jgi:hypothetical protein